MIPLKGSQGLPSTADIQQSILHRECHHHRARRHHFRHRSESFRWIGPCQIKVPKSILSRAVSKKSSSTQRSATKFMTLEPFKKAVSLALIHDIDRAPKEKFHDSSLSAAESYNHMRLPFLLEGAFQWTHTKERSHAFIGNDCQDSWAEKPRWGTQIHSNIEN